MKTFLALISDGGAHGVHGLPASDELKESVLTAACGAEIPLKDALAVKCGEDLFLVCAGDRGFLYEESEDGAKQVWDVEALLAGEAPAYPEELKDFETEVSFAPGIILNAVFTEEAFRLNEECFPCLTVKTAEKYFLLILKDSRELIFFDARRFLFYALTEGRIVSGFAEIPGPNA